MGRLPAIPNVKFPITDIATLASAHVKAIQATEAANHRFLVVNDSVWLRNIAEIIALKYGATKQSGCPCCQEVPVGYPVVSRELNNYYLAYLVSFFNMEVAFTLGIWGMDLNMETTPSRQILGLQYPDISAPIHEMVETMIKFGIVPDQMTLKHEK